MDNSTKPYRIFVALPDTRIASTLMMRGIFEFNASHPKWTIDVPRDSEAITDDVATRVVNAGYDGIICIASLSASILARFGKSSAALGTIGYVSSRTHQSAAVLSNNRSLGRDVAAGFLARGFFRSFGFIPARNRANWSEDRKDGFTERLADAGYTCAIFRHGKTASTDETLGRWLLGLQKPTAILAASDAWAEDAIRACHRFGLKIPSDVAISGVNNNILACEHCNPPLTSVAIDYERQGYRIAELLNEILESSTPCKSVTDHIGAAPIAWRASTPDLQPSGSLVQRGIDFIHAQIANGITAADVVRHLKVSHRLASLRFHEIRGESITDVILAERLERTRKLLVSSNAPIAEVCRRAGWASESRPKAAFAMHFGMSMRDYRNLTARMSARSHR